MQHLIAIEVCLMLVVEFNFSARVKIERKNVFARFLKSRKVTFEVYHQRSFLMRDVKIGQAELKLQDLLNQSTAHEFVDVSNIDIGARSRG